MRAVDEKPVAERPTISLCMIVKNGAGSISAALRSVRDAVDEMIVVDTGSTDGTVEIARNLGARTYRFEWREDFAAARNYAMDQATGDWVLTMDADEELLPGQGEFLRTCVQDDEVDAYSVTIRNYFGPRAGIGVVRYEMVRLFRRRPGYRYVGRIHEQILQSILKHGGRVRASGLQFDHFGYLDDHIDRGRKKQRNLQLLEKAVAESPRDAYLQYQLGVEYKRAGKLGSAIRAFQQAFKNLPGLNASYAPALLQRLAETLLENGQPEDALKVLTDAEMAYPAFTDLVFTEAECHLRMKRYTLARRAFERCLALGDAPAVYGSREGTGGYLAFMGLGRTWQAQGRQAEALAAYIAAIDSVPGHPLPLLQFVDTVAGAEDPSNIQEFLMRRAGNADAVTSMLLGQALGQRGMVAEGLFWVERAQVLVEKYGAPAYWDQGELEVVRGDLLWHLGFAAEAREAYRRVQPESQYSRQAQERLAQLISDTALAVAGATGG